MAIKRKPEEVATRHAAGGKNLILCILLLLSLLLLTVRSEDEAITYKNSITAAVVILRFRVFSFHGIFAKPLFNELPSANKNNADYLLVCTNMIKVYKQIGRQPMVDAALQNIGAKIAGKGANIYFAQKLLSIPPKQQRD